MIFTTQLIKTIIETKTSKKFNWFYFFMDGGMPSSHASLVSALITSTFFYTGFSIISFITLAFGFVIIRDSFGQRLEVGKHKLILEKIAKKESKRLNLQREGHTIKQVFAGFLVGFVIMFLTLSI